ncbi:DUF4344 domain-containing metallopeptidase [Streptomyces sp. ME18-1-4]|uniref:DUF4344 domain-containing metallopeptidase n=1 Tax=Streptomyces sp. ME18-1-4 TaxID=3028685 RepID=UPI0029B754BE|nr:DUF4344 domain-containing metallopeptidase [Streptomyces sp. ME18-1-4]MDX3248625.1 DUF4344 domain-containing metallopeptidase [Streptomyces sp. ME18-1-4]
MSMMPKSTRKNENENVGVGALGRRRGRTALQSALLPLLLAFTTACQTTTPAERPSTAGAGFSIRYDQPSSSDAADAAFLRKRRLPEEAVRSVTALVEVSPPVAMVVRSCHGEGSAYDPDTRRVEVCYDEISETRDLYQDAGQPLSDDTLSAVTLETLFHESAHAVLDALDLRASGREEDFADQFAALMLLRQGVRGEDRLLAAAEAWRLSAITYENVDDGQADEHSTDHQRAVNYLCYVYGAAPARHQNLVDAHALPVDRARGCTGEWKTVQTTWLNTLGRHARHDAGGSSMTTP